MKMNETDATTRDLRERLSGEVEKTFKLRQQCAELAKELHTAKEDGIWDVDWNIASGVADKLDEMAKEKE